MVKGMELIEIIYSVLIYGGGALFAVVLLSFIISKMKGENVQASLAHEPASMTRPSDQLPLKGGINRRDFTNPEPSLQFEQNEIRKKQIQPSPKIFQIDQRKQREIKIIRKPTFHTFSERNREEEEREIGTNSRYLIVNEEMRKVKTRVMNFYL